MNIFNLTAPLTLTILLPDKLAKFVINNFLKKAVPLSETLPTYFERTLFNLFQLDNSEQLPIAAVTALGGGLQPSQGGWLRADPCEIVVGSHSAYLLGGSHLHLTPAEMDELHLLLNPLLTEEGMQLHMLNNQEWCLQLAAIPQLVSTSPSQVIGKEIQPFLLQSHDAKWQRLITEIQMLLYDFPVNQRRAATGLPVISSLWVWGEGELPKNRGVMDLQQVWSDDILVCGLSLLTGTPLTKLPASFSQCLSAMKKAGKYLLDLRKITEEDQINAEWLMPILSEIRRRKLAQVNLCFNDGSLYSLNHYRLRPWWRKIF